MRRLTRLRRPQSLLPSSSGPSTPSSTIAATTRHVDVPAATTCRHRDFSSSPAVRERTRLADTFQGWAGERLYQKSDTSVSGAQVVDRQQQQQQQRQQQPRGEAALGGPAEDETGHLAEQPETNSEIETDLTLPPRMRWTEREDLVKDASYVPASSADGLEEVGGLQGWWTAERWGESKRFVGFGPRERVSDPTVLEVLARRALIEALAMRSGAESQQGMTGLWERGGRTEMDAALGLGVEVAADGNASLKGDAGAVVQGLRWDADAEAATPPEPVVLEQAEAVELLKSWDDSWKQASLDDPVLKFAVTKRVQQLTGLVVPDSKLPTIHTAQHLLAIIVKPDPPKKLHDELLASRPEMVTLPNVSVRARRVTPIDRAKADGSWKVIVRELQKRELPITGTKGLGPPVEKAWIRGDAESQRRWRKRAGS